MLKKYIIRTAAVIAITLVGSVGVGHLPAPAQNPSDNTVTTQQKVESTMRGDEDTTVPSTPQERKKPTEPTEPTCNHHFIEDGFFTDWGEYQGKVCIYCGEGEYWLVSHGYDSNTEEHNDENKDQETVTTVVDNEDISTDDNNCRDLECPDIYDNNVLVEDEKGEEK